MFSIALSEKFDFTLWSTIEEEESALFDLCIYKYIHLNIWNYFFYKYFCVSLTYLLVVLFFRVFLEWSHTTFSKALKSWIEIRNTKRCLNAETMNIV